MTKTTAVVAGLVYLTAFLGLFVLLGAAIGVVMAFADSVYDGLRPLLIG